MPGGGTLSIRAACEGGRIRLAVRDTGGGMDERTRARMFEPFFTTKPAGKGTGLGLMVVAHVVQRAGGDIAVSSAPGAATEIAVTFPEATPRDAAARGAAAG
jgi:signal transduction histidine kinase